LAVGYAAAANGLYSVAIGSSVTATGSVSIAFGFNTTTQAAYEEVIGQYNRATGSETATIWKGDTANPIFVIGIGTSGQSANALMVFQDGQMLVDGGTTVAIPAGNASLTAMGTSTTSNDAALSATNSSGASLLYVRDDGNVGIGTTSPQAPLDINGYARLSLNSSQPVACSTANRGSIALNHLAEMCACNGSNWIFADSTGASCSW
jgi:hypothetical protein